MYFKNKPAKTTLVVNQSTTGETIEQKMRRVTQLNEPITDSAPIIYTDRKDGVAAEYDIRTDRFELAVEAMDRIQKSKVATRENYMKVVKGDEGGAGARTETNAAAGATAEGGA